MPFPDIGYYRADIRSSFKAGRGMLRRASVVDKHRDLGIRMPGFDRNPVPPRPLFWVRPVSSPNDTACP